jgi:hypothetical protein
VIGQAGLENPPSDPGNAFVYYGAPTGVRATPDVPLPNPSADPGALFGFAVSGAGDLDGDGYIDIVIGAPRQDSPETDEGNAYVYYGGAEAIDATPDVPLVSPTNQRDGYFGDPVAAVGDLDGDGYSDLACGAKGYSDPRRNQGAVFVYPGTSGGVGTLPELTLHNPLDQIDGVFGAAIARVCRSLPMMVAIGRVST